MGVLGAGAAIGAVLGSNSGSKSKQKQSQSSYASEKGSLTGGQKYNTTQTSVHTPWQQGYQRDLLNSAQNMMRNMPDEFYPGFDTVANMTSPQMAGMQSIMGAAGQQASFLPQATGTVLEMLQGKPNMEMWSPMMNMVRNQITGSFKEDVLPAIASEALQYGGYGGGGHRQELDIGAGRVAQQVGNAETQMMFQAMQDAQNQRGMALQALPGISSMAYQPGQMMMGVGETLQAQSQRELDAEKEAYFANLYGPMNMMGWYKDMMTGDMGSSDKMTSSGSEQKWGSTSGTTYSRGSGTTSQKTPGDPWSGALGGMSLAAAFL